MPGKICFSQWFRAFKAFSRENRMYLCVLLLLFLLLNSKMLQLLLLLSLQVKEGPGFVFLSFIEVTSFLPRSIFWTILFFLMLLLLGLGTTIGFMQGLIVPLQDSFSFFRKQTKLLIGTLDPHPSGPLAWSMTSVWPQSPLIQFFLQWASLGWCSYVAFSSLAPLAHISSDCWANTGHPCPSFSSSSVKTLLWLGPVGPGGDVQVESPGQHGSRGRGVTPCCFFLPTGVT